MNTSSLLFKTQEIQVRQNGDLVELVFADGLTQSVINKALPALLPHQGNQAMLSHLLFTDIPQSVLLGGCGGGSIARWFNCHYPETHGIAIEIEPEIIQVAKKYFQFPDKTTNWQLQQENIRTYLQTTEEKFDFILIDIENGGFSPVWTGSKTFIQDCQSKLTPRGVLTINCIPESAQAFAATLWTLRQQFRGRTCCLSLPSYSNIFIMAFMQQASPKTLRQRSQTIKQKTGLDLSVFIQQLKNDNPEGSGIF